MCPDVLFSCSLNDSHAVCCECRKTHRHTRKALCSWLLEASKDLGLGEHPAAPPAEQKPLPLTVIRGISIGQANANSSNTAGVNLNNFHHRSTRHPLLPCAHFTSALSVCLFYLFNLELTFMCFKTPELCYFPTLAQATAKLNFFSQG